MEGWMPAQRLTMRRIRQMLRMHFGAEASDRTIARELSVARSTIRDYLDRAKAAGLSWPLPDELSDEVLEERLFARAGSKPGLRRRAEPEWAALVREMKRPGVNLMVLWEEHRESHPDGYGYSRFCELYRGFEHRLAPTMRQHHVAGDKLFVDYSGKRIDIVDPFGRVFTGSASLCYGTKEIRGRIYMSGQIRPHNERPAAVWSSGGRAYEEVSRQIASAIDHAAYRLAAVPGETILDLATGTGWGSRIVARQGATVTGADIAADLLTTASARAKAEGLNINYQIGDAEALPFADANFDGVISTFGVMFASNQEAAAGELARVCRPGGRVVLATWTTDGAVAQMFQVMRAYMPPPPNPAPSSPFTWGARERVTALLGRTPGK